MDQTHAKASGSHPRREGGGRVAGANALKATVGSKTAEGGDANTYVQVIPNDKHQEEDEHTYEPLPLPKQMKSGAQ